MEAATSAWGQVGRPTSWGRNPSSSMGSQPLLLEAKADGHVGVICLTARHAGRQYSLFVAHMSRETSPLQDLPFGSQMNRPSEDERGSDDDAEPTIEPLTSGGRIQMWSGSGVTVVTAGGQTHLRGPTVLSHFSSWSNSFVAGSKTSSLVVRSGPGQGLNLFSGPGAIGALTFGTRNSNRGAVSTGVTRNARNVNTSMATGLGSRSMPDRTHRLRRRHGPYDHPPHSTNTGSALDDAPSEQRGRDEHGARVEVSAGGIRIQGLRIGGDSRLVLTGGRGLAPGSADLDRGSARTDVDSANPGHYRRRSASDGSESDSDPEERRAG